MRGHHVYKHVWTPVLDEELTCIPEENNNHDVYAVAVMKEDEVVGHVPCELSKILYYFLKHAGEIYCVVTDKRKCGVGLKVPCVYKLKGKQRLMKRLKQLLASKI